MAVEALNHTDEYISLFHRYISRSIEALATQIGPAPQELNSETREQAWHLLDYALKLAHGWQVAGQLLLTLAPLMEREGFRREWLPFLERGVACAQRAGDLRGEAHLALYVGRLFRLRTDYGAANQWLERSATLFQQVDDGARRARALNQLAYVARLQNNFDHAKALVTEAFALLDEDDVERASCHWVLGTIANVLLQWDEGEYHNRRAYEIWQTAGDQQRAAWGLQNLGHTLRGAGRYTEAAANIERAIQLLGELHDPVNQAIARMGLGIIHIYNHAPDKALALFQLAEPIFRQVGDQLHLAMVYTNMTIVQRDLGHFAASAQSGQRALYHAQVINDPKIAANAADELGTTHLANEDYAEAEATLTTGLELIAQVPPDSFQSLVQNSLREHLEAVRERRGTAGNT